MTVRDTPPRPHDAEPKSADFLGWLDRIWRAINIDDHIEKGTPVAADEVRIFSVADGAARKSTLANLLGAAGAGTVTSVSETLAKDDTETISGVPVTVSGTIARTGVDAGSDKLVGWDDSADKKIYFTLGTGLTTSGSTLNSTGGTATSVDIANAKDDTALASGGPVTATGTLTLTAVDAGSDKLVGWDDSADKKVYFTLGTGLTTSGTTLNSTGGTATSVALSVSKDDTITVSGSPVTGSGTLTETAVDAGADKFVFWDDSADKKVYGTLAGTLAISGTVLQDYEWLCFAIGDETTAITTGTAKLTWHAPEAFTLLAVFAGLTAVSTSGIPTVDINEAGTTVLSTKLTIDANESTSATAANAAVISDSAIAQYAAVTFDFDVAGTGAKGMKVYMKVRWIP